MGLFDFLRKKTPAVTYRLTWFELQINPMIYRFAIMPSQPILIGLPGENGAKGSVLLLRYDHAPQLYDKVVEQVDALIGQHRILSLPMKDPNTAFQAGTMQAAGTHLRFAFADKTAWAGAFAAGTEPAELREFVQATKDLAKQVLRDTPGRAIDGDAAHEQIKPENNAGQKNSAGVIMRIKVSTNGTIFVNRQESSLAGLNSALDELATKNGQVWYHREGASAAPADATWKVIEQVLDAVMARKLPIRMLEEEI